MDLLKYDPNTNGGQYLESLATAYWYSDALFTALDSGLFDFLDAHPSVDVQTMATALKFDAPALTRFLHLLKTLSLVDCYKETWYNTQLAQTYLVVGKALYQGGNIRWRRELKEEWSTLKDTLETGRRTHFPTEAISEETMEKRRRDYLRAMDAVIHLKTPEIMPLLGKSLPQDAQILDIGAGGGGFTTDLLAVYPKAHSTLMDIRQILPHSQALVDEAPKAIRERITTLEQNVLDPQWQLTQPYDLIILSNIVHAYSPEESAQVLKNAAAALAPNGLLLIHEFYLDHWDVKSHLSDINMLCNTYNGQAYKSTWVRDVLEEMGLVTTALTPLKTDTGIVFGALDQKALDALSLSPQAQLMAPMVELGFHQVIPIDPAQVVVTQFPKNKCHFGCSSSNQKHCAHHEAMTPEDTQKLLDTYTSAFLLKGEPPTGSFQRQCLSAETAAFKAGFYKAFTFWAGPCSICPNCDESIPCTNRKHSRPSMEGSGIDVFATVTNVGETLKTLSEKGEVIKYYALLLLE